MIAKADRGLWQDMFEGGFQLAGDAPTAESVTGLAVPRHVQPEKEHGVVPGQIGNSPVVEASVSLVVIRRRHIADPGGAVAI
jgi:hypothetical protein